MSAEGPYIVGTLLTLGVGMRDGSWDDNDTKSLIAGIALIVVMSFVPDGGVSDVFSLVGWLYVISLIIKEVEILNQHD